MTGIMAEWSLSISSFRTYIFDHTEICMLLIIVLSSNQFAECSEDVSTVKVKNI